MLLPRQLTVCILSIKCHLFREWPPATVSLFASGGRNSLKLSKAGLDCGYLDPWMFLIHSCNELMTPLAVGICGRQAIWQTPRSYSGLPAGPCQENLNMWVSHEEGNLRSLIRAAGCLCIFCGATPGWITGSPCQRKRFPIQFFFFCNYSTLFWMGKG